MSSSREAIFNRIKLREREIFITRIHPNAKHSSTENEINHASKTMVFITLFALITYFLFSSDDSRGTAAVIKEKTMVT